MNQTTQQIPSNPAQRLADKILARTNNGRDLIDLLHDIAQGGYDATLYDRVTTTKFLYDRGFGKCPKQSPASGSNPNPAPAAEDIDVRATREAPPAVTHKEPQSPRLVNRLGNALHDSLGPVPKACPEPVAEAQSEQAEPEDDVSPDPFDHFSIQSYIIEITNDGETLVDVLIDIAFADPDDPEVTPYYRSQAGRILADRSHGTDPASVGNGLCPSCRRKWTTHPGSPDHPERSPALDAAERDRVEDRRSDEERWTAIEADLKRMEDESILTPDPNGSPIDISNYRMPKDFDSTPYEEEEFASFKAEIELRIERQKQWPEIEERRRKKLARIYPSHSDGDPPDT